MELVIYAQQHNAIACICAHPSVCHIGVSQKNGWS